jgi:hypothetical protein
VVVEAKQELIEYATSPEQVETYAKLFGEANCGGEVLPAQAKAHSVEVDGDDLTIGHCKTYSLTRLNFNAKVMRL